MPKKHPYGQFCPLARSLDLVGDRWSMLIVRELFVGPCRYGELLDALGTISTDVLAKRLREMESTGVIERREDGRYDLTADGRGLAPALRELARWGAGHLAPPGGSDDLPASRAVQVMVVFGSSIAAEKARTIELRAGDLVCSLSSGPDGLVARRGPGGDVDAVVTTDDETLWAVCLGLLGWTDALASGMVLVEGDAEAAEQLLAGRLPGEFLAAASRTPRG